MKTLYLNIFPRYAYTDMVAAQHTLITQGLGIDRLRLVLGTSMGGMQTWMWGGLYPTMMEGLLPLVCLPAPIAGRNRMLRRMGRLTRSSIIKSWWLGALVVPFLTASHDSPDASSEASGS